MASLGDGRSTDAWSDLLAVHRLARLAAEADAGSLVGHLMATAVTATTWQATLHLLDTPELPGDLLATVRRDLDALPPWPAPRRSIVTERLGMLDFMIHVSRMSRAERAEVLGVLECQDPAVARTFTTSLDWNTLLGEIVADYARLDAALAAFRLADAESKYPERLEVLVPRFLDQMPLDPFTAQPFRYERRGDGYLLISAGQDGRDDGGTDMIQPIVEGEWSADASFIGKAEGTDLVVRLPLPANPALEEIRAGQANGN